MPRDGSITRDAIMQTAQSLIYRHGFAGMTLDKLLAAAKVSKGSFFYHFKSRDELGDAIITAYAEEDAKTLAEYMDQAQQASPDALEQVIAFLTFIIDAIRQSPESVSGCIYGSYGSELDGLSPKARETVKEGFLNWRKSLAGKFRVALQSRTPATPAKADDLADLFMTIYEGAILTGRALDDREHLPRQLEHYRNYIQMLFGQKIQNSP
jgi:TetR/AcrR family transcriptional regulator, transcriptional repressor for nem operon